MTLIQKIGRWLSDLLGVVLMLLPESPFQAITTNTEVKSVLGWLNYFVPVTEMLAIFQLWLTAIAIYYVYSIVLRWAKAIE